MAGQITLTREQYVDSIRDLATSVSELASGLTIDQMTWQPNNAEGWSICECLDHIAISTGIYLDAMQLAIGDAKPAPPRFAAALRTAGLPSAKFVRDMEPPPRRKFPAPGKIRPRATLKPEGILPACLKAMDRVCALIASSADKDLNSARFRNPLFPLVRFTVATGFLIIAAHGRRHVWQAVQVTRDAQFPR